MFNVLIYRKHVLRFYNIAFHTNKIIDMYKNYVFTLRIKCINIYIVGKALVSCK